MLYTKNEDRKGKKIMTAECQEIAQKTLCGWWMYRLSSQTRLLFRSSDSDKDSYSAGGAFSPHICWFKPDLSCMSYLRTSRTLV